MKRIFSETSEPVSYKFKFWDDEDWKVYTREATVTIEITAHYDDELRALVVDQNVSVKPGYARGYTDWLSLLPTRRTMETHETRAQATRRAIVLADEWIDRLSKSATDDERPDEVVQEEAGFKFKEHANHLAY